ncbi:MAG TPA: hypothetical protein VMY37_30550 [Thermoguttaceae bacterium]|nr:hypothetical protein [Thermoguttaceae bacterium]
MAVPAIGLLAAMMLVAIVVGAILVAVSLTATERGRTLLKALLIVPPAVLLVIAFLGALFGYRAGQQARIAEMHAHGTEEVRDTQLGRSHQPAGRLSGTITCNKRPLPRGTIRVVPNGDRPMPIARVHVVDGRYSFAELSIGSYRVEVTAFRVIGGAETEEGEVESLEAEQYLPERYNEQSELRVTVGRGENDYDMDLSVDLDQELADGKVPIALAVGQTNTIQSPEVEAPDATELEPPPAADSASEIAAADPDVAAALTAAVAPAEKPDAAGESAPAGDLPDWVGAAPHKVGGIYQMAIEVGPFSTRAECDQEASKELRAAIDEYVATYLGPQARGQVRLPIDYVRSEVVTEEGWEELEVRITPEGQIPEKLVKMPRLHLLLKFPHKVNLRLKEEWGKVVVHERLYGVGALGVLVFVLLGAVWSYLRIDLATGGAYRGRLRLVAATLVLIAIVVGWMLVRIGSYSGSV